MRSTQLQLITITALWLLPAIGLAQTPLGTEFTYQGQLSGAGTPAVGNADFRYSLFNAAEGGVQIGATLSRDNVALVNGQFTLPLDFGASAFNGEARWIEVSVRSPAGAGSFTTLAPRQQVTATPYATQTRGLFVDSNNRLGIGTTSPTAKLHVEGGAITVSNQGDQADVLTLNTERSWVFRQQGSGSGTALKLESVGGGGNKNFLIATTGAVGIGTSAPTHTLHIASAVPTIALQDIDSTTEQVGFMSFRDSANAELAWVGYGTVGDPDFSIVNARPGGDIVLTPIGGGKVGIGTASPAAALDVAGTARVQVLEITGADVAEKFPASEKLEPGMVVAIDKQNPGKLCLSRGAYNRCVAGIVSGANSFPVGAVLGSVHEHKDAPAIALSGRVYVHCAASDNAIEPGDLLTTSHAAGRAMKVTDHSRAQGAIIGKAMTGLARNQEGMVLVLVNLQ